MQKKVKIFFIPLSWITKVLFRNENSKEIYKKQIENIPKISADDDETKIFRVKIDGNINENDFDIELKKYADEALVKAKGEFEYIDEIRSDYYNGLIILDNERCINLLGKKEYFSKLLEE